MDAAQKIGFRIPLCNEITSSLAAAAADGPFVTICEDAELMPATR
jgi:hypothetical protein